jgi:hypothetical protein
MSASAKTSTSPSTRSIPARTAEPLPPWLTVSRPNDGQPRLADCSPAAAYSGLAFTRAAVASVLPSSTTSTLTVAGRTPSGAEQR